MIEQLIAEATECDFKVALETKKPKSWLKSVSAFSYGIGGTLFFGVSDDREPIGLSDVQKDAEAISRLIKERITPLPQFILKPLQEDGKNLLALEVSPGRSTPYYYKADGVMEAYIRVGNESVIAPDYIVNELILKGTNQSFDSRTLPRCRSHPWQAAHSFLKSRLSPANTAHTAGAAPARRFQNAPWSAPKSFAVSWGSCGRRRTGLPVRRSVRRRCLPVPEYGSCPASSHSSLASVRFTRRSVGDVVMASYSRGVV